MSVVVYTDESGTHSNRYLVISALITSSKQSRKRIKNLMSRKLVEFRRPDMQHEIHSYHLTIPERQDILTLLASKQEHQIIYLVADKNHLKPELAQRPNLCFNYLYKHLAKKIVTSYNEDIDIIGDNRTVAAGSKNSLPEYIQTEAYAKWGFTHNLNVCFMDSRDVKGLQAADVLASAIYAKYNMNQTHLYDLHTGHYANRVLFPYEKFGT